MEKVLLIKSKHTTTERDKRENGTTVTQATATAAARAQTQKTTKIVQVTNMIKRMPISMKNVYEQRKSQKPVYSELFSALFRLPDKQVQQRVLNAINGNQNAESLGDGGGGGNEILCKRCKCKLTRNKKFVDTGTQTVPIVAVYRRNHITKENHRVIQGNRTQSTTTTTTNTTTGTTTTGTTTASTSVSDDKKNIIKIPMIIQATSIATTTTTTINANENKNSHGDYKEKEVEMPSRCPPVQTKRGRKRRTCVPQVVKHSHAEQVQQEREDKQLTPIIKKKRKLEAQQNNNETPSKIAKTNESPSRRDSNLYGVDFDGIEFDLLSNWEDEAPNQEEYILKKMAIEYLKSECYEDGLLPIHDAILKNDKCYLQRQIFVWTKLKSEDLNNLLTHTDEDCLELAIMSDCIPEIMSILLKTDLALNNIYECSNNVIHLAIINNIDENCLLQLMERVDMQLLLERNDEGYTPIHIAVRQNLYKSAEIILNTIDRRILGSPCYARKPMDHNDGDADGKQKKEGNKSEQFQIKRFSKFYEDSCEQLDQQLKSICLTKFKLKRKLLDMCETRGGTTALLYAVENELEHFTYFLLAHLSNPTTENHSGQSAKTFHYEFARTLQLSLKVSRAMDKVVALLDK